MNKYFLISLFLFTQKTSPSDNNPGDNNNPEGEVPDLVKKTSSKYSYGEIASENNETEDTESLEEIRLNRHTSADAKQITTNLVALINDSRIKNSDFAQNEIKNIDPEILKVLGIELIKGENKNE
jgi:hypothetical protein